MRAGSKLFVAGALLFGLVGACDRDRNTADTTRTTSAPYGNTPNANPGANVDSRDRSGVTPDTTTPNAANTTMRFGAEIDRLAAARCDREVRCNNVGADNKYDSRDHCLSSVKASMRGELNQWDCAGGIHTQQLDECLNAIQKEDCGNPIDTVGRLVACRSGDLCSGTP
jgi:hypothetical protein